MATLYQINQEIENLTNEMIDPETGEINEEIMEQLEQLEIAREQKIESIGIVIKSKKAFIADLKAEKKTLDKRIERETKEADRLKEWLSEELHGDTYNSTKVTIKWRRSKKTEITDVDLLPKEYIKCEVKESPMLAEIGKALDKGEEVPGAVRVERNNIQIG